MVAFYLFLNEELFLRRNGLIAVPHRTSTGTIPRVLRDVYGLNTARGSAMQLRPPDLSPDTVMADVRLGLTVTGLYTLVGMGIVLAFM